MLICCQNAVKIINFEPEILILSSKSTFWMSNFEIFVCPCKERPQSWWAPSFGVTSRILSFYNLTLSLYNLNLSLYNLKLSPYNLNLSLYILNLSL